MRINYQINIIESKKHLIGVRLVVESSLKSGQEFWLPDWIPGSYLIRDFSKNIVLVRKPALRNNCTDI